MLATVGVRGSERWINTEITDKILTRRELLLCSNFLLHIVAVKSCSQETSIHVSHIPLLIISVQVGWRKVHHTDIHLLNVTVFSETTGVLQLPSSLVLIETL